MLITLAGLWVGAWNHLHSVLTAHLCCLSVSGLHHWTHITDTVAIFSWLQAPKWIRLTLAFWRAVMALSSCLVCCVTGILLRSHLCCLEKLPLVSCDRNILWVISHCWWPFICHHFWGSKRFVPGDDMSASSLTFHRKQIYFSICTRTLFRRFFVAFCHIHLWSCFYLSHCNKLYYSVMP